jgi:hypothetical protein
MVGGKAHHEVLQCGSKPAVGGFVVFSISSPTQIYPCERCAVTAPDHLWITYRDSAGETVCSPPEQRLIRHVAMDSQAKL